MTDYTELVRKLRDLHRDPRPASAVWLFDNQVALYDAAAAIEALQYEIRESMQKCAECGENEPKRGKWIWIQKENGGQYKGCSVCHAPIPTDSMLDYLDDEDCDFCYSCGAKMEVQDG